MVSGGETVLVTDRDRVVAELVPPGADRAWQARDALLAEAVRQGWLVPPVLPQTEPPPRLPVAPWSSLHDDLATAREDR